MPPKQLFKRTALKPAAVTARLSAIDTISERKAPSGASKPSRITTFYRDIPEPRPGDHQTSGPAFDINEPWEDDTEMGDEGAENQALYDAIQDFLKLELPAMPADQPITPSADRDEIPEDPRGDMTGMHFEMVLCHHLGLASDY